MKATAITYAERFAGCLLGGAIGDALGAAIEFDSLVEIRRQFGPGGLRDFQPAYGRVGAITDDTQMTLFTAEGLALAFDRGRERGIWHPPSLVHAAYLRWLQTQNHGRPPEDESEDASPGWLLSELGLHASRAPGNTCLSALRSGRIGTVGGRINNSKGCGGVMRAAPAGLAGAKGVVPDAFDLGCQVAAITHGHPSGYLPAGFLALVIARLIQGRTLLDAVTAAREILISRPEHAETLRAVDAAIESAQRDDATPETTERIGGGWTGEEALAIALFACLKVASKTTSAGTNGDTAPGTSPTALFSEGVLLAVNHGGDSDSTGSVAGNILGALWGKSAIPDHWLERLELRSVIERTAWELYQRYGA